jgi:hypothetical protein
LQHLTFQKNLGEKTGEVNGELFSGRAPGKDRGRTALFIGKQWMYGDERGSMKVEI